MSPAAQMVEEAAKRGFQIARLLNAKGVWQAAFKDDGGTLFAGSGDTLEAALRDALDSAPTTGGVSHGAAQTRYPDMAR